MRYLLDTNICIYAMQRAPIEVFKRLAALRRGDVAMSVITLAELLAGIEKLDETRAQNEHALKLLCDQIAVLPFDREAARSYGILRAAVPERRRNALDRLIAAHAHSRSLTVVTNDESDFAGYPGLAVENWARSDAD